jgi:hypothetical protein
MARQRLLRDDTTDWADKWPGAVLADGPLTLAAPHCRVKGAHLLPTELAQTTGRLAPFINGRVAAGLSVAGPRQRGRASVAVSGVGAAILPCRARR